MYIVFVCCCSVWTHQWRVWWSAHIL